MSVSPVSPMRKTASSGEAQREWATPVSPPYRVLRARVGRGPPVSRRVGATSSTGGATGWAAYGCQEPSGWASRSAMMRRVRYSWP